MTIKELIELLEQYPETAKVVIEDGFSLVHYDIQGTEFVFSTSQFVISTGEQRSD